MQYNFEWYSEKARGNYQKHGISFEQAATVFKDSRAVSVYDAEHSTEEDRWATLGLSASGGLLVVHHTFDQTDSSKVWIRIISSRKATKREAQQYAE